MEERKGECERETEQQQQKCLLSLSKNATLLKAHTHTER